MVDFSASYVSLPECTGCLNPIVLRELYVDVHLLPNYVEIITLHGILESLL